MISPRRMTLRATASTLERAIVERLRVSSKSPRSGVAADRRGPISAVTSAIRPDGFNGQIQNANDGEGRTISFDERSRT